MALAIEGTLHAHTAAALELTQASVLAVDGADHAHAADAPELQVSWVLTPLDAVHAHVADELDLAVQGVLSVAGATHGHLSDSPALLQSYVLAPSEALHQHTAAELELVFGALLVVDAAGHEHSADVVGIVVDGVLEVDDALHEHTADSLILVLALTVPLSSRYQVPPNPRRVAVQAQESVMAARTRRVTWDPEALEPFAADLGLRLSSGVGIASVPVLQLRRRTGELPEVWTDESSRAVIAGPLIATDPQLNVERGAVEWRAEGASGVVPTAAEGPWEWRGIAVDDNGVEIPFRVDLDILP